MSGIDAVIARSRQPGAFSERKQFTVSRSRGIQKMRRFALADPHFYILELIQSAIANHARYIDIQIEDESCTCAYIGGGLKEAELAQLFDFLFASKDRTDIGHIRELALGVNAVLLFKPTRVVVESGDGTLAGTTRMVLHGTQERVEIGRPQRPLAGTYISIQGMQRGRLPSGFAKFLGQDRVRECDIIETRCLAAPVPILVNHQPLFGHSTQRTPGIFGYRTAISFDEGDLYGTLGHKPSFGTPAFQLLTWGVSIQAKTHDLIRGQPIGGVVCFDRLHKTVDHSGIVEDARLEEMWVRLWPYAEQLVTGTMQRSVYAVTRLDGRPTAPAELRELLRAQSRIVLVPGNTDPASVQGQRAAAIGRSLEAVVLRGVVQHVPAMRALSGGKLEVIRPALHNDDEVRFYGATPATDPPPPWHTPPVDVAPIAVWKLAARLRGAAVGNEEHVVANNDPLTADLGGEAEVHAKVFTPATAVSSDALDVRVRTSGRDVWTGPVASPHAGHVLVVEFPDASIAALRSRVDDSPAAPTIAAEIGRLMAAHAVPTLVVAFERAVLGLRDTEITPGSAAAGMGLSAVVRSVLPRLRDENGEPHLGFSQLEALDTPLLDLPLLRTSTRRAVSIRDVADLANGQGGLVYGTLSGVPADLDGLDPDRILDLTEAEERQLVMLLGESSYVRVDARDVLAESHGLLCRDLALGLRPFPDFPLLVEGIDPATLPDDTRRAALEDLLGQLVQRFLGQAPSAPPLDQAWEHAQWEECRRQACRHLQWLVVQLALRADASLAPGKAGLRVCFQLALRADASLAPGKAGLRFLGHQGTDAGSLADLPLFLDVAGEPCSFRQLQGALGSEGLGLYYGHCHGPTALGELASAAARGWTADPDRTPTTILATPYLHRLLARRGRTIPAFDFSLRRDARTETEAAFLADATIDGAGMRGTVGIPAKVDTSTDIVVLLPGGERMRALSEIARTHGVVGWVRIADLVDWNDDRIDELAATVRQGCEHALARLLEGLADDTTPGGQGRRLGVLLAYAARHLSMHADRPDHVVPRVHNDLVNRILALPLFPSRFGGPISAWRLIRRFCSAVALGHADPLATTRDEVAVLPPELDAWLRATLHPSRVVREPGPRHRPALPPVEPLRSGPADPMALGVTLTHWLAALRPDVPPRPTRVMVLEQEEPISASDDIVFVSESTEIARWAIGHATAHPRVLAWLLLAVYASVNEALERVTNAHELEFQRRVADAVAQSELFVVRPTMR